MKKFDAFGISYPTRKPVRVSCSEKFMDEVGLVLDPKTGSTSVEVKGKINLYEKIQSYKDSCGIDYARRMIAQTGNESLFADDGKHGVDCTILPDNLNDAYAAKLAAARKARETDEALGGDGTYVKTADLEKYVEELLAKKTAGQTDTKEVKE